MAFRLLASRCSIATLQNQTNLLNKQRIDFKLIFGQSQACLFSSRSSSFQSHQLFENKNQSQHLNSIRNVGSSVERKKDPLDLTFEDTHAAYKSKRTSELFRAYAVLTVSSFDFLVQYHDQVSAS